MELKVIQDCLSVTKIADISTVDLQQKYTFLSVTDEEISLVCKTENVPGNTTDRDDGWRAFRIQGILDFSLIGIHSKISGILADHKIGIFAVSTYNTDYVLVKQENFQSAIEALRQEGYDIVE